MSHFQWHPGFQFQRAEETQTHALYISSEPQFSCSKDCSPSRVRWSTVSLMISVTPETDLLVYLEHDLQLQVVSGRQDVGESGLICSETTFTCLQHKRHVMSWQKHLRVCSDFCDIIWKSVYLKQSCCILFCQILVHFIRLISGPLKDFFLNFILLILQFF